MFKKLTLVLIAVLLVACNAQPTASPTPAPLTHIRLPMGYIPNVQFAPFYVALEKGYFREAGIDLEFDYKFETDGVTLVGANELPFALVSGEQVLLARAQSIPVVYVMAWYQQYPIVIVAKKSAGINALADLKGKKIGLPGLFGATYVGLRALLREAGIKESEVTLDSIGFNQVDALSADQEQAVIGYAANEPIQLKARGYDIVTFPVSDYVQLASNGLITNETTLAQNPALVRAFVQAALKGLADTIADPSAAFEISRKYIPDGDKLDDTQKQVLLTSIEQWKTATPGLSDPKAWENMQTVLLDMGSYPAPLDLSKAFTNNFVK